MALDRAGYAEDALTTCRQKLAEALAANADLRKRAYRLSIQLWQADAGQTERCTENADMLQDAGDGAYTV